MRGKSWTGVETDIEGSSLVISASSLTVEWGGCGWGAAAPACFQQQRCWQQQQRVLGPVS